MKKSKSFTALVLLMLLCFSSMDAQKHFKEIDATSASFSGGMRQSGGGITYNIIIILLTNQKIAFTDIWVSQEHGTPEFMSYTYADGRKLVKGDTAIVRYTIHRYPPDSPLAQASKPEYKAPPIPIQGEALLGFTVGKVTRYRSVGKFKVLPRQNYP
jgi:hypothetical protein